MPKHRSTVYTVVRHSSFGDRGQSHVVGTYLTAERAEEIVGQYTQDMKDKGHGDYFYFEAQANVWYEE